MRKSGVERDPKEADLTLLWFVIWLIWDLVGDEEPLTFDPVNWWAGSLLFVLALDLARQHAPTVGKSHGSM